MAAVLAYLVLGERLDARRRLGLTLGFTGIVLISVPKALAAGDSSSMLGIGYLLLGALGVAWGNVVLKCLAGKVDVLMAVGWQLTLGSLPLLLAAHAFEVSRPIAWAPSFVLALLSLSLLGTALASVLWFSLLRRAEISRLNAFTFLTPIFGLLMGMLFFDERLNGLDMAGVALALVGVRQVVRTDSIAHERQGPRCGPSHLPAPSAR
jgi:drug/metabolite transporter (DMT)-like permease